MNADQKTLGVYDTQATKYARVNAASIHSSLLAAFIASLTRGARVLDLGCGPGHLAAHMAAQGLIVDATDASGEMVALAAAQTGVTAWQATFDKIAGDAIYDGIWANFSLLHAPRADMPRHLTAIKRALKPDGKFHIAVKSGTGTHRDGIGRFYTYYTKEELTALLEQAGFTVTSHATGREPGLDGTMADWLALTANG